MIKYSETKKYYPKVIKILSMWTEQCPFYFNEKQKVKKKCLVFLNNSTIIVQKNMEFD